MTRSQLERLIGVLLRNHPGTIAELKQLSDEKLAELIFQAAYNKFAYYPTR